MLGDVMDMDMETKRCIVHLFIALGYVLVHDWEVRAHFPHSSSSWLRNCNAIGCVLDI